MPGLSQLKKFNSDILSLGNEPELRAKRGEKAIQFPLPKGIKDVDDSDDFVMGMPEPVNVQVKQQKKDEPEDFSDIMGTSQGSVSSSASSDSQSEIQNSEPGFSLPDLSLDSIVNLSSQEENSVPDLSMFMEEPEEEPEIPEEPEEKQIDELSLDDLLGGAGFDGSEGMEEPEAQTEPEYEANSSETDAESLEDAEPADSSETDENESISENTQNVNPKETKISSDAISEAEEPSAESENFSIFDELNKLDSEKPSEDENLTDEALESLENEAEIPEKSETPERNPEPSEENQEPAEENQETPENKIENATENTAEEGFQIPESSSDSDELTELPDADGIEELSSADFEPGESFSLDDFPELKNGGFDFGSIDSSGLSGIPSSPDFSASSDSSDSLSDDFSFDTPAFDLSGSESGSLPSGQETSGDFNLPEETESAEDSSVSKPEEIDGIEVVEDESLNSSKDDDFSGVPGGLFDANDLDVPDLSSVFDESSGSEKTSSAYENPENPENPFSDDFDFDLGDDAIDLSPDSSLEFSLSGVQDGNDKNAEENIVSENSENKDSGNSETAGDSKDAGDSGSSAFEDEESPFSSVPFTDITPDGESLDGSSEKDFPDNFNFNLDDDFSADSDGTENVDSAMFEEGPAPEDFDMSAMEGLDFPDTDTQLNGDFELHDADNMSFENADFEIPGYTGDNILDEKQQEKLRQKKAEPNLAESDSLPPNTLTDDQYRKFLSNLSKYPLNVRIALEDLIVKNEFTDDAEFEIVQKVLKKVPARTLAAELEKMLDIPISVPRDFERRTAEEYDAYKASFSYQLRNKIVPGAIISVAAVLACVGLFYFTRNCVYRPMRANSLYRQGYEFLQSDDYPQSEVKFNEATKFNIRKKWFYRYAQGYREHKQFIRAENMYRLILNVFNHEKQAGLEYAQMELDDLANYERAEEILKREVLDNYINDADGLLLLGDTYLEWATEKDSSKFEDARVQYSNLLNLYGKKDAERLLYQGRMMRYFVRTDNLLEVLQLKDNFMTKRKTLDADGWTEMSGYLLDKLYGEIEPSEEYLRTKIEDVKEMLMRAVREDETNPLALYNLSKYYVYMNNGELARSALQRTVDAFASSSKIKRRDMYKYIDSYRLYGEEYANIREYLKAMEQYTNGISLYQRERDQSGFEGDQKIGKLYEDMGNIDYFISGDMESALLNYQSAVETENDIPEIRYKIGYIKYNSQNYAEALGSFMKTSEEYPDDINLLLAMGNTLSLRNDNFASQGYYEHLLDELNLVIQQKEIRFPQTNASHAEIVDSYMKATNNLGVTFYRLARRTGSSLFNANAMVNFQESLRAWDSLTRNQETMLRLPGGNLAEQNLKYISQSVPSYEPAIYTELQKTLYGEEELR